MSKADVLFHFERHLRVLLSHPRAFVFKQYCCGERNGFVSNCNVAKLQTICLILDQSYMKLVGKYKYITTTIIKYIICVFL